MRCNRIHRLAVLNGNEKLVGVLSSQLQNSSGAQEFPF
jgi:hypothetical protein